MLPIYDYSGNQKNVVELQDIINDLTTGGTNKPLSAEQGKVLAKWDVERVTVNGVTCNFYKNNHLVICILQSSVELQNATNFENMVPSGYNPKDLSYMNIVEVSGTSISGQARFTFYPDLAYIRLFTSTSAHVERNGVIVYYVD